MKKPRKTLEQKTRKAALVANINQVAKQLKALAQEANREGFTPGEVFEMIMVFDGAAGK